VRYNLAVYEANKNLGQNFLLDYEIAQKLIDLLEINTGEVVVEIGAGLGALTEQLAKKMDSMDFTAYALEIDSRFIPKLESMFVDREKLFIEDADVLSWLPEFETDKPLRILGALPFYITSPILHATVKMHTPPKSAVFVVQKEVGEKISSKVPDASYLSTFVQTFFEVTYVDEISRKLFDPQPNVDGAIIVLKLLEDYPSDIDKEKYEGFLHRAFSNPRKMLNKAFAAEDLERGGIDPSLRAEAVPVEKWVSFFRFFSSAGSDKK
jgi:16S rRNA (adenine1518-N6/adenine1519-N6)-dimethyltransferase